MGRLLGRQQAAKKRKVEGERKERSSHHQSLENTDPADKPEPSGSKLAEVRLAPPVPSPSCKLGTLFKHEVCATKIATGTCRASERGAGRKTTDSRLTLITSRTECCPGACEQSQTAVAKHKYSCRVQRTTSMTTNVSTGCVSEARIEARLQQCN